MKRLENKTALITAAAQGIGKSTALMFAENGAKVIATDINEEALAELDGHDSITTHRLDVLDKDAINSLAETVGKVDILFNCAGYVHGGNILECSEKDWDFAFNINVKSMYHMIQAWLPKMIESGGGNIINMSSVASSVKGVPNRFVYTATKAAVLGMTKAIAADFISQNVRCNAICPGTVQSPSLDQRLAEGGNYEKAKAEFIARQPIGRIGEPDEIAALVTYLASDESAYTTGTFNMIDGGWTI